jgi:hypothetical protein
MDNMYDKYGCCNSCGYTWCEILNECIRVWETECSNHRILTQLQDFNINELMLFIIGVLGALGGLCLIIQKSKCKNINLCCLKCERDTELIKFEDKLEKGIPLTPKPTLELIKEPEIEEP